jgi:hypothetical protein
MALIEEEFTNEHEDYHLVADYLRKTFPTLAGDAPGEQARLSVTEKAETGYTITVHGTLAASDGSSGVYEMKLAVEYGDFPTVVYLQSAHRIALGDVPLEE